VLGAPSLRFSTPALVGRTQAAQIDLMLSLFADDAKLTSGGKTYQGKNEIRSYWQSAEPQNQWVAYTPAFRIKYAWKATVRTYISSASMWIR
jgi:hypothetical protein